MRLAIFSDVHANLFALQAVLDDARRQRVEGYWFLGDLVGCGPLPWQCVRELRDLGSRLQCWLLGNEDQGLLGFLSEAEFGRGPWYALRCTQEYLLREGLWEEVRAALEGRQPAVSTASFHHQHFGADLREAARGRLSEEDESRSMWGIHGWVLVGEQGEPRFFFKEIIDDPVEDCANVEKAWQWMYEQDRNLPPRLLLSGHAHLPLFWKRREGYDWQQSGTWEPVAPGQVQGWPECPRCHGEGCRGRNRWAGSIPLGEDPVLINPGSVGQPRDGCPMASYAVLDLVRGPDHVTFRRVPYDIQGTQALLWHFLFSSPLWEKAEQDLLRDPLEGMITRLAEGE